MMVRTQARTWHLFFCMTSISMLLLLAIASSTSSQTFNEIYRLLAEFLSLSKTSLSMSLRNSPGLGHLLCYALLSLSLSGSFSHRNRYLAPLVAGFFGVSMEVVQAFIPSRDASLLDIGVNALGIAIGFGIYRLWVSYAYDSHSVN